MRDDTPAPLSRRRLFAGAGAAGALATVAAVLPEAPPQPILEPKPSPSKGGGYQVTEHVLRYYQTARV